MTASDSAKLGAKLKAKSAPEHSHSHNHGHSHELQLEDADGFYERLMDAHAGLSRDQSEALNACLVLLLANQVGSAQKLEACLSAAVDSAVAA